MDSTQGAPGYRFNPYVGAWEPAPAAPTAAPAPAQPSARRGAGRPARGADKRTRRIGLSVSESEHAALAALAEGEGVASLARWSRERLLSALRAQPAADAGEVARLRADLAKVGSNLNQIARALNAAERGGPEGPRNAEVLEAIEATRWELAAVREWTREAAS